MRWAEKRRADEQKTRRVIFLKHEDMKNRKNPSALFCPQDKLVENNPAREIPPEPPLLSRKRALQNNEFSRLYKALSGTSKSHFWKKIAYHGSIAYMERR